MARLHVRIVIGMLIGVHLVGAALLSPIHMPANSGPINTRILLAVIGSVIGQPALIAIWAALAPQPFARRWPFALGLLACDYLAIDFASVNNLRTSGDPAELLQFTSWFIAFLLCQLPLWPLRSRYRWRLQPPATLDPGQTDHANQFSLRKLLVGVAMVAGFLAALRWLHPDATAINDWPWHQHLLRFAGLGAMESVPGLLVLVTAWIVLLPGTRGVWRWFLAITGSLSVAAIAAVVAYYGSPGEVGELIFLVLGLLLSSSGSLLVIRLCGYRLARQPRDRETAGSPDIHAALLTLSPRRFALVTAVLLAMLAGLALVAPARLQYWREAAENRRWAEIGLHVGHEHGQVVSVGTLDGGLLVDAVVIGRIGRLTELERLNLEYSTANDETLRLLPAFSSLATLSLKGTHITDDGLKQLAKFPNLEVLSLQMTDVSDDGLKDLLTLQRLRHLDLKHTKLTATGIRWLKQAKPDLHVDTGTDDGSLRQIAGRFRRRRTRLEQAPVEKTGSVRLHARGAGITNAGIAALRGVTEIGELDLQDAAVTDAAVGDLVTLTGLKRLILLGTQITEAGAKRIQRELPDCAITR